MDIKHIIDNQTLFINNQVKRGKDKEIIQRVIDMYNNKIQIDFKDEMTRKLKNIVNQRIGYIKKNKKDSVIDNHKPVEKSDIDNIFQLIKSKETFDNVREIIETYTFEDCLQLTKGIKIKLDNYYVNNLLIKNELHPLYNSIGNILHDLVPNTDDVVVSKVNNSKLLIDEDKMLGHYDLTLKTGIVNYNDGIAISGNRGYCFIGLGVKLNRALISYAIDFLEKRNFVMYETPHIMNESALDGVTQLEDYDETLYKINRIIIDNNDNNKYLIATSEQPLTGMFRDKKIPHQELPIRIGGLSHCYRKETGSAGKDTLGIFRVHQFEKVEQFVVCDNSDSWKILDEMIECAKDFYNSLGLSYQIVSINAKDLNNTAAMKYDLEGYFPTAKNKYKELVSCSNCTDYISKKINVKDSRDKIVHLLNGTLCANTRTICCILENYQTETGIKIPDVLVPYMNGLDFIEFVN